MTEEKKFVIGLSELDKLILSLKDRGYKTIGPTVRDGAIIYDEISSIKDIPVGWTDEQGAGFYRLRRRDDGALFGYVVGPQSWKKFLYPPFQVIFEARKNGNGFKIVAGVNDDVEKFAFIGVRACELSAILIQDKIFAGGEYADPEYVKRRENTFIVAVNCTEPGGNCFCHSAGTGPKCLAGYDIALTEIIEGDKHYFLVHCQTELGMEILGAVGCKEAVQTEVEKEVEVLQSAIGKFTKRVDLTDVVDLLQENYENPLWEKISEKCLTCGNCTLVCPTCFCSTVEDFTDLTGQSAKRVKRWDSCFTLDFSYIHGGSVRYSVMSRYKQWMTHKLSTWKNQFGMLGCVGCGRCITWCPVGIDITEGVKLFKEATTKKN